MCYQQCNACDVVNSKPIGHCMTIDVSICRVTRTRVELRTLFDSDSLREKVYTEATTSPKVKNDTLFERVNTGHN